MKLEIPVKVYFNDVQGMIDEVKKLQTYKLFEGDDMVLVDLDAVVAIMANHVEADKCSETPNGWIPVSKERPPQHGEIWITSEFGAVELVYGKDGMWQDEVNYYTESEIIAWMPANAPSPYQPEEESE